MIPALTITWECMVCHCSEKNDAGRGCAVLPDPLFPDHDAVFCDRCHTDYNVRHLAAGAAFELHDGTPTRILRTATLDGAYRYRLERSWFATVEKPPVVWIMLNPSTANDVREDQTLWRIIGFTRRWGFHRLIVVNLFGFVSSVPAQLPREPSIAVGPENNEHVTAALGAGLAIAAWGVPGAAWLQTMTRWREGWVVDACLRAGVQLMALGTTADGSPKHPLARGRHRIPDHATPQPWSPR